MPIFEGQTDLPRRAFLKAAPLGLLALPQLVSAILSRGQRAFQEPIAIPFERSDEALLDEVERAAFSFYWSEASSATGQVRDRARMNGDETRRVASIAATGFGLTALCIADSREYTKTAEIAGRVRQTLRFLKQKLPNEHGFFYHFIDLESGERAWKCELSSIDTSLLLCGVLTARQHFNDAEIQDLATAIYERVDWRGNLLHGMEARRRIPAIALEPLLRTHDDLPTRIGFAYASCAGRYLEGVDAAEGEVWGV